MTLEYSRVTLPPLWTVDQVKIHLHITGTAHDADIQQKLTAAQDWVLSLCSLAVDPAWTAATAPPPITHAIQVLTAYYYRERGDGDVPPPWDTLYSMLALYRDPVVA